MINRVHTIEHNEKRISEQNTLKIIKNKVETENLIATKADNRYTLVILINKQHYVETIRKFFTENLIAKNATK